MFWDSADDFDWEVVCGECGKAVPLGKTSPPRKPNLCPRYAPRGFSCPDHSAATAAGDTEK